MSSPAENSAPFAGELESAADQAIAACGGDAREAVKALIVANDFLEARVAKLPPRPDRRAAGWQGFERLNWCD